MHKTPLYDALRDFSAQNPLRMHMPGHKGKPLPGNELTGFFPLDFTELPPTGDLFDGGGVIAEAEALWADVFRMDRCLFLTGGSTQGMHTALAMTTRPGDAVLIDRCCHRSVFHALALLDLRPVYLTRPWLSAAGTVAPISPAHVENLLELHPEIKTLCITSPTYYGILSDVPALSHILHRHGGTLVVDAAHGAHLPFLDNHALSAADVAVVSAHKTLPAPGQSALLLTRDDLAATMLRFAPVYGSSSPSYPMMAALDLCRAHLSGTGGADYRRIAQTVAVLRQEFPSIVMDDATLDPTRLVLHCPGGFAAQRQLEGLGIYPEMADSSHLVFILTCSDRPDDITRLRSGLSRLALGQGHSPPPPPLPELVCTPRQALFSTVTRVPLHQAVGRISAGQIAPYPPGIPIVAPGERVEKKTVAYLAQIGYNIVESVEVVR